MARTIQLRKAIRVVLDEEVQPVHQRDSENGYPLYTDEDGNTFSFETAKEAEAHALENDTTLEPVMEDEPVPVVKEVGRDIPEEVIREDGGTIFHLAQMDLGTAMRFSSAKPENRFDMLDKYAGKAIVDWEGVKDQDGEDIPFDVELIDAIPVMDRLFLVMHAVNYTISKEDDRKKGRSFASSRSSN